MSRYGGFNYWNGDSKAVPIVDAWTFSVGGSEQGKVSAVSAYCNFELSEANGDGDGEVFINIHFPDHVITVSPREAKAIANLLNKTAGFIVDGVDELTWREDGN